MSDPVYICRRCGKPNEGEAAPDPAGAAADGQPSYMHPACARIEAVVMTDARHLSRLRLEKAAPDLLAACEAVLNPENYQGDGRPWSHLTKQVRDAIAKARGQ